MDSTLRTASHDLDVAETMTWHVEGMDCASCVAKVERAVGRLPGVSDLAVNLMAERMSLRLAPNATGPALVEQQIAALGYRAQQVDSGRPGQALAPSVLHAQDHDHSGHDHAGQDHGTDAASSHAGHMHAHGESDEAEERAGVAWWRTGKARLVALLGALVAVAFVLAHVLPREAYWIYLATTLIALWPFGRRAVALARAGTPFSIETLMCAAALGAVVIGAAEEAAVVVLLFAIGELLENVAAGQARAGIRALASLIPSTARRETSDGRVEDVPAARLALGDLVQVRPGDRVPCDGEIIEGHSALDESPVTGESVPVPRGPSEPVLAGSVNADAGLLRVRVTRAAADNTVARIVRLVEEASASRAPSQRFVERFSRWWTPGAMAAALLVILVPPLLFGGDWWTWTYRGLALLLIACPCALVISVPAAVASGLSAGARRGLLVKGGAALEALGAERTVAFDKTGTLTEGKPRVTDVVPFGAVDEREVLRLAAAVEQGSSHPLGRAILARAAELFLSVPKAEDARAVPGRAVEAVVEGRRLAVGSPRHVQETGATLGDGAMRAEALEQEGKTCVVLLADGAPLGLLAMRDEPRPDAAAGVAALRAMGIRSVMLTGDNERAGRAIANKLGLDVRAGLLPADKLREIAQLKAQGPVVMVGDGINDAPALAAASVGVAMGGGTDVALEAADAALMRESVSGVAELVGLSRSTLANIRQNIGVAVGLKASPSISLAGTPKVLAAAGLGA